MKEEISHKIWTIGHSTHMIEHFIEMLKAHGIKVLADVRNYPGSKRYPHFNKDALADALAKENINYIHFKELGGRRKPVEGSKNTAWRHAAFRGYADYMQTNYFKTSIKNLEEVAAKNNTVYMCSEAVWWSCHRSMISDELKLKGWIVLHIMTADKTTEHPYTSPARIVNGELSYSDPQLF